MKKHIFSSYLFKNKEFFKILKTNDVLNYLAKFVEQICQKHIAMHQKVEKTLCFVTSPKF
jgi:hypothetical protein